MNAVFRVDASVRIGTGHVTRCLALARALRDRGVRSRFVCRDHPGHMLPLLEQEVVELVVLEPPPDRQPGSGEDYSSWLGVSQEQDAEDTIGALGGDRPDLLVVDHYGLGEAWERRLRPHAEAVLVLDDLADRRHECDVLLDQNYACDLETRYLDLIPDSCRRLLGPRFALLDQEYAARRRLAEEPTEAERVLAFFGGSDLKNMTSRTVEALSGPDFEELELHLVIGPNHTDRAAVERQAGARPRTVVHEALPHLADLMRQAQLGIGAGGTTMWERMCMGLPSVVVSVAENQRPGCQAAAQAGLIEYLGFADDVRGEALAQTVRDLIADRHRRWELARGGQAVSDGLGASRVAEVLAPTPRSALILRPARRDDLMTYFAWANDPSVRRQAVSTEPIEWSEHAAWFEHKLGDPDSQLFVLQARDLPVGQVRLDWKGDSATIDYSIDRAARGRGWGREIIARAMASVDREALLLADVKVDNEPSRAVFERLSFEAAGSSTDAPGCVRYRRNVAPRQAEES